MLKTFFYVVYIFPGIFMKILSRINKVLDPTDIQSETSWCQPAISFSFDSANPTVSFTFKVPFTI